MIVNEKGVEKDSASWRKWELYNKEVESGLKPSFVKSDCHILALILSSAMKINSFSVSLNDLWISVFLKYLETAYN